MNLRAGMAAWRALVQMMEANPQDHRDLRLLADTNNDGAVSFEEFTSDPLFAQLMAPDVGMFDADGRWDPQPDATGAARDRLSFGIAFTLIPCDAGRCMAAPSPTCTDRVLNQDETDIDCGGATCHSCGAGARCAADRDCGSGRCTAGRCDAPSCSDGRLDGWETDVDCGGVCPTPCAGGQHCYAATDCARPTKCEFAGGTCR